MKFFLIVAKGKKQGMPIPVEIDLFLIGSGPVCQLGTMSIAPPPRPSACSMRLCSICTPKLTVGGGASGVGEAPKVP